MKAITIFLVSVTAVAAFSCVLSAEDTVKGFSLTTIDGKTIDYGSLRGMPVVINFGAHW